MITYTIQEDDLPIVEAHIIQRDDGEDEFAVLTIRYGSGMDLRKTEYYMSEMQLMRFSNAIVRAIANIRRPIADMDYEAQDEPDEDYDPDRVTIDEQCDAARRMK